jgi:prepilin-type processing-associated H-X9-DG protein
MLHTISTMKATMMLLSTLMILSCKKENLGTGTERNETNLKAKRTSESLLTSVVRQVQTSSGTQVFKQLDVSYDSGRVSGMINFAFGDGSVRNIRSYEYDAIGRLARTTIKDEGYIEYTYGSDGHISKASFKHYSVPSKNYTLVYNRNSQDSTVTEDRFDSFSFGVERIMYKFYPDGTFKSVEKFDPQNGMKLKAKMILQNNYEPKQLDAWKKTVSKFPEPILPMPVLTMLATKIEMFAESGYCCDDVIVDGRIIIAQNVLTNFAGQTIRIRIATTNNRSGESLPVETIFLNYGR